MCRFVYIMFNMYYLIILRCHNDILCILTSPFSFPLLNKHSSIIAHKSPSLTSWNDCTNYWGGNLKKKNKKVRKQGNKNSTKKVIKKKKVFFFFFLVEFLFSCFLNFLLSFINSHLWYRNKLTLSSLYVNFFSICKLFFLYHHFFTRPCSYGTIFFQLNFIYHGVPFLCNNNNKKGAWNRAWDHKVFLPLRHTIFNVECWIKPSDNLRWLYIFFFFSFSNFWRAFLDVHFFKLWWKFYRAYC